MKIERVRTFVIGNPWKNWVIVRVETDEGIAGLGEATSLTARATATQVEELSRVVIGMDPRDPGAIFEAMRKAVFLAVNAGMVGIEIACWDILGKSLGVPLYRLLGGRFRERVRAYANGWYQCEREPSAFAERAAEVMDMGYGALKFDPFGTAHRELSSAEERLSLSLVRAVREAVGDDVDLLIEGHNRFTPDVAIRVGRALAEFRPLWFEAPVIPSAIGSLPAVARAMPVPVACGERFAHLREFADVLSSGEIHIVQPEGLRCGGVGGVMKVAALAEAYGASVACHQAQSPLYTAVNAHLHAAMPNSMIQECCDDFLEPWAQELFPGVPPVVDGCIEPSEKPGIGVEFDEKEAAKYPYDPDKVIRLFESGWESRKR